MLCSCYDSVCNSSLSCSRGPLVSESDYKLPESSVQPPLGESTIFLPIAPCVDCYKSSAPQKGLIVNNYVEVPNM